MIGGGFLPGMFSDFCRAHGSLSVVVPSEKIINFDWEFMIVGKSFCVFLMKSGDVCSIQVLWPVVQQFDTAVHCHLKILRNTPTFLCTTTIVWTSVLIEEHFSNFMNVLGCCCMRRWLLWLVHVPACTDCIHLRYGHLAELGTSSCGIHSTQSTAVLSLLIIHPFPPNTCSCSIWKLMYMQSNKDGSSAICQLPVSY
jgi:hypothetical protein